MVDRGLVRRDSVSTSIETEAYDPAYVPDGDRREISVLDLVNLVLRHRRLVFWLPVFVALALVAITVLHPRSYTASASLMPQGTTGGGSRISGLAAQFGIAVPGTDPSQSPAFYAALLTSREILQPVIESRFAFQMGGDSTSGTLVELLKSKGDTRAAQLESAIKKLQDRLSVDVDRETGLVEFHVQTQSPDLSFQVAQRVLDRVNEFNIRRRQLNASTEGTFIEEQLTRAQTDLRQAENQLQEFLQRNRVYAGDPRLSFEHDRLQRGVMMRQELFTSLYQSLDQTRIDAVRDTPPMAVIEAPHVPARPNSRGTVLRGVLGLVLGGMLAILIAVLRDFVARSGNTDTTSGAEFAQLRSQALADLGRLRHPFRRSERAP